MALMACLRRGYVHVIDQLNMVTFEFDRHDDAAFVVAMCGGQRR